MDPLATPDESRPPATRATRQLVRILVTGASGFVGSRVTSAFDAEGHEVRAMTRRPERYEGAGSPVAGDVRDEGSLREALEGGQVAYYLVHPLDDPYFERTDADAGAPSPGPRQRPGPANRLARHGRGEVGQISTPQGRRDRADWARTETRLSRHLRSRREVERLLGDTGVPVTVLRAGIGSCWRVCRWGYCFSQQHRITGGIQGSMLTHVVWSALMLRCLPPLFARRLAEERSSAPR